MAQTDIFMKRIKSFFGLTLTAALLFFSLTFQINCTYAGKPVKPDSVKKIITGADRISLYFSYIKAKNIGMVVNQTSVVGTRQTTTVDSLLELGIKIKKIFGPEHGFRGNASNGAVVGDEVDAKTRLPVVSLYGKHYKPTPADLKGLDILIFDIQDVGARFYTYISTLHYVMEACAENNIELIVLDRPNPNGLTIDGPILDTAYASFVGMHKIPIAHGMTIAEYAQMINGEGWLAKGKQCKLKIIKMANYSHATPYKLPVNPSPNLNTYQSILLYPSVCLFEGTTLSLGRGTMEPFQVVGHPSLKSRYSYAFKPVSIPGMSEDPPQKNMICYGIDLKNYNADSLRKTGKINLSWLIKMYNDFPDKPKFFNAYFTKLAGTEQLRKQIEQGMTEQQIRSTWQPGLNKFKAVRKKYLLYQ